MKTRLLLQRGYCNAGWGPNRTVTDAGGQRVHRSTLLIDSHNDVTSETVDGLDIGSRTSTGHTDTHG